MSQPEPGSLRTRKSILDFRQFAVGKPVDERVFGEAASDEQDGLLQDNAEVINMSNVTDDGWEETKKLKPRKRRFICSLSACMKFMFAFFVCGFFTVILHLSINGSPKSNNQLYYNGSAYFDTTVIYISLDGFRNDYLDRKVTPNLDLIAEQGIRADYMMPSFPSITFPNHWTLVTGLYPEAHGIVANEFYDPDLQEQFIHKNVSISGDPKWWGGEPIWVTSRNQGKKSAVIMWPGSNIPIRSVEPNYAVPYVRGPTAMDKMDIVLGWLDLPLEERPQSISVYVPQVDQKGHGGGPDGKQLNGVLKDMDDAIGHLMRGLSERNIDKHVHLVIVSDHGMAASDQTKYIYYDHILSPESESYLRDREAWPLLGLRVKDDAPEFALDQIYSEIIDYTKQVEDPHFQVFKRQNIPARFHYNSTERIAPIVLLPDVGYAIVKSTDRRNPPKGIHGYDNLSFEMRAIFAARGPKIENSYTPGTVVSPFYNTEMYRFLTTLLDLEPAPSNATLDGVFNPLKFVDMHR